MFSIIAGTWGGARTDAEAIAIATAVESGKGSSEATTEGKQDLSNLNLFREKNDERVH